MTKRLQDVDPKRLTDDELMRIVIGFSVAAIQAQHKWQDWPLAVPSRTPEQRDMENALWNEVLARELHHRIHNEFRAR